MTQPLTTQQQMMPMQNLYAYAPLPMQAPSANAVKIDIHQPMATTQPAGYSPYAMPQASAYTPFTPYPQAQFLPTASYLPQQAQTLAQPPVYAMPQTQAPAQPAPAAAPAPAPVVIPTPVAAPVVNEAPQQIVNNIPVPPTPVVQTPTPVATPAPAAAPTEEAKVETPVVAKEEPKKADVVEPKVEEPAATPINIDVNEIVSNVNSADPATQLKAIETIAETAQTGDDNAKQLLDSRVMDSLGGVIKRDTSQMQAPTPEQLKLRQRLISGEKLTPTELESADKLSEMEIAEKNKQYALFTVAILQKLLAAEVKKAQGTDLPLSEYPMINDVVKVAKADSNPLLRASALASLSYIADPSNKALLTKMFEQSAKDSDPNVKQVAEEALSKLSQLS